MTEHNQQQQQSADNQHNDENVHDKFKTYKHRKTVNRLGSTECAPLNYESYVTDNPTIRKIFVEAEYVFPTLQIFSMLTSPKYQAAFTFIMKKKMRLDDYHTILSFPRKQIFGRNIKLYVSREMELQMNNLFNCHPENMIITDTGYLGIGPYDYRNENTFSCLLEHNYTNTYTIPVKLMGVKTVSLDNLLISSSVEVLNFGHFGLIKYNDFILAVKSSIAKIFLSLTGISVENLKVTNSYWSNYTSKSDGILDLVRSVVPSYCVNLFDKYIIHNPPANEIVNVILPILANRPGCTEAYDFVHKLAQHNDILIMEREISKQSIIDMFRNSPNLVVFFIKARFHLVDVALSSNHLIKQVSEFDHSLRNLIHRRVVTSDALTDLIISADSDAIERLTSKLNKSETDGNSDSQHSGHP